VGELLGDGCVLRFSNSTYLTGFDVCLRISTYNLSSSYVPDFGYRLGQSSFIHPLGVDQIRMDATSVALFWCAYLNFSILPSEDGMLQLFPIERVEDYESQTQSYVDQKTKILMYFLGVCYGLLFVIFGITLVIIFLLFLKFFR
jgi:hypothetical protein